MNKFSLKKLGTHGTPECRLKITHHHSPGYLTITGDCVLHPGHGDSIIDMDHHEDGTVEIIILRVAESHRKHRFGTSILQVGLKTAFEASDTVIIVIPCRNVSDQPWLQDFFEGHGFTFQEIENSPDCLIGTLKEADWERMKSQTA